MNTPNIDFANLPGMYQPHVNPDGTEVAIALYFSEGQVPTAYIHPTATIKCGLKVVGTLLVGPNVEIGNDVTIIGDVTIEDGVKVRDGATEHIPLLYKFKQKPPYAGEDDESGKRGNRFFIAGNSAAAR